MEQVRVRFAPSPTGYLHIGGARTALFNWFFARQNKGKLVLRIEDTDTERLKEDSVGQILDSLKWLGIDWDEGPEKGGDFGPYYQSQRKNFYTAAAESLIQSGKAYYCFCTAEELEVEREKQRQEGVPFHYNRKCRDLSSEEVQKRFEQGLKPVIRIKLPNSGHTVVQDIIRGEVRFNFDQFDDFIIMKSNGLPAYNFACVVDDHAMKISHVIRAEEHLSNTPKQQFLYQALGYEIPRFAHLSMILAPDRSKLSKRHGATSVSEFKDMGCLPEAIINYLTLLGWSPTEEQDEIITPEQTIQSFELNKVSKTAAIYDIQKLVWLNGQYITKVDLEKLTNQAIPFLLQGGILTPQEAEQNPDYLVLVIKTVRERVRTLQELAEACRYLYQEVTDYDEKGKTKYFSQDGVADLLTKGKACLAEVEDFTVENTEKAYRALIEELNIKGGMIIHPTRLALTGRTMSPGLFDVMAVLGKEKCLIRLEQAVKFINTSKTEKEEA
ncbi:glutamate--tRNA ligase [Desulfitobacterium sp.]|uniref:glutamate--tRNA ligase n=1 Tax=Desulfitobacterium sp. TaxID=49981 RepID=UPI002CC7A054|nr:glutamate--tRNA ligase [Desulfitobacterium sp.]HVJ48733.1 glutamate--tRNA ligase [Desulfitobacterium sp.]